jgi:hypothetical protein
MGVVLPLILLSDYGKNARFVQPRPAFWVVSKKGNPQK